MRLDSVSQHENGKGKKGRRKFSRRPEGRESKDYRRMATTPLSLTLSRHVGERTNIKCSDSTGPSHPDENRDPDVYYGFLYISFAQYDIAMSFFNAAAVRANH